ncbi:MAG TPA: lipopolysaccharide biosynthesis protein [Saprospiraceae bacterium]|nr:lipopolysaccharide biosynthesis protein [Saprospiraceae bacterium]HMQ84614.1 lipopolysaccharide biosynthesis protein [Saprospiraceae bacterium]
MGFKQSILSALKWTASTAILSALLNVVKILVLIRLLEEKDFGMAALSGVFINLGLMLQEAGLSAAVVQKQDQTEEQLSSIFWLNTLAGVFLFLLIFPLGWALAWFYAEPALLGLSFAFGLSFLFNGPGAHYKALLQRNMQFKWLGLSDFWGKVAALVCSLILAWKGWGAYAILLGLTAHYATSSLFCLWKGRALFHLQGHFSWRNLQGHLEFAGKHLAERLGTHLVYQLDVLIIGKCLGTDALGVYDVFKRLLLRFSNIITQAVEKVAYPVLSRFQNRLKVVRQVYFDMLGALCVFQLPLFFLLVVWAYPVVKFVFGESYLQYVDIFRWVCLLVAALFISNPADTLLLSLNRIEKWLYANLLFALPLTVGIVAGCRDGLEGAVLAQVVLQWGFALLTLGLLIKPLLQANFYDFWRSLLKPLLLATGAVLPTIFIPTAAWTLADLVGGSFIFAAWFLLLLWLFFGKIS